MVNILQYPEFECFYRFICDQIGKTRIREYWVPEFLVGGPSANRIIDVGDPYRFYAGVFERIAKQACCSASEKPLSSQDDYIYQAYIRTFASLNGEIGTALKQIAFLPFLKQRLGISVFISLPTGVIGVSNRKGRRGSPFAVRNPFAVDDSLGDRLALSFPAEDQYRALVQACRMSGMRPGSIVPLSTLAMDCPLFWAYPDLGYWWLAEPGDLLLARCPEGVSLDTEVMPRKETVCLRDADRPKFAEPPQAEEVETLVRDGSRYYAARVEHDYGHELITLANAFPDPVAGDRDSYTWKDVATVRYDTDEYPPAHGDAHGRNLDQSRPAWRIMPHLLAWRAQQLGEQCFLIDVNESVPEEILGRAAKLARGPKLDYEPLRLALSRANDFEEIRRAFDTLEAPASTNEDNGGREREVIFIAEELWNFSVSNTWVSAVVGPLVFCVSAHSHNQKLMIQSLRHHLKLIESEAPLLPYFGGVANHDTMPPVPHLAALLHAIYSLLPACVPMIYSGNEFNAHVITNTEFGFSSPELRLLQSNLGDEDLALFNDIPLDWTKLLNADTRSLSSLGMVELLESLRRIRSDIMRAVRSDSLDYKFLEVSGEVDCFGYRRACGEVGNRESVSVYANWSSTRVATISWDLGNGVVLGSVSGEASSNLDYGSMLTLQPQSLVIIGTGRFRALQHFQF